MHAKHVNSLPSIYRQKAADELEHPDDSGIDLSKNLANLSITESPRSFVSEGM